jgi:arylsulfatase
MDRRVRMRTLRDHRYRLTLYDGQDWGELYDLSKDPLELRNLWFDAASLPLRQGLSEQLARAMLAAADGSPYPDAMA